jgi:CheY-like chemotaxis protein
VAVRAVIVDDQATFADVARGLLEREGIEVVGAASTSVEAVHQAARLQPDVMLIDVELGEESGFDLARRLAATTDLARTSMILVSAHAAADFAELVTVSPVLGFLPKQELSADVIRDLLEDRTHGHGCRHEALVYSTAAELVAGAAPFVRHGLEADDAVLVVMREAGREVLRDEMDGAASQIEFADADHWYRSTQHAFDAYRRYVDDRLERGARRIRILAEAPLPRSTSEWWRYETEVGVAMASIPVSFVCAYDTRKLPASVVAEAPRAHPLLRSGDGPRPSARYADPAIFVAELG